MNPNWWKALNDPSWSDGFQFQDVDKKLTLKNTKYLPKVFPDVYEMTLEEVKEHNRFLRDGGKTSFGKKIGSIPLVEYLWNPELKTKEGQDKWFKQNPKFKAENQRKYNQ